MYEAEGAFLRPEYQAILKTYALLPYMYKQNYVSNILLAPTGALILMMVRDISVAAAPAFSDFHSVHWCN